MNLLREFFVRVSIEWNFRVLHSEREIRVYCGLGSKFYLQHLCIPIVPFVSKILLLFFRSWMLAKKPNHINYCVILAFVLPFLFLYNWCYNNTMIIQLSFCNINFTFGWEQEFYSIFSSKIIRWNWIDLSYISTCLKPKVLPLRFLLFLTSALLSSTRGYKDK